MAEVGYLGESASSAVSIWSSQELRWNFPGTKQAALQHGKASCEVLLAGGLGDFWTSIVRIEVPGKSSILACWGTGVSVSFSLRLSSWLP
jgi:hypothetical protein